VSEVAIRRLFRVVNGGTPTSDEANWNGDVLWATPIDLAAVDGGAITSTTRTLTRIGVASGSATVSAGSLVLSTRAPIGYVAATTAETAFNQGCRGLVPRAEFDLRFFRYQLLARRSDLVSHGQGSTFAELSSDSLAAFKIRCPAFAEQRSTADFLDAETARIDALIEKKRRMTELLEERRIAVTVTGVTNPAWPRVKLTLLVRLGSGHTPSRDRPEWWENPTIPWITTGDVAQMRGDRIEFIQETKFSISELGLTNSAAELHPVGTVVLSRTASVGFSAIMARPMATSQDFATWTCGPRLRPRFLLLCLRAMRGELLGRLAMGSTHKTIYMPDIEAIRLPLPTLEEQERAVAEVWERLRPIDAAVTAMHRQIDLLRERRQALITAAVTGHLDIASRRSAA
jgi:type I restriction enzyme S subunit